jgi:hypothetical protein
MAKDNRTYGFSLTDAESLAELIGGRAMIIEGRRPVGGSGGGGGATLYRFETTAAYTSGTSVTATIKTMAGTTFASGATLKDPEAIFIGMASGAKGYCIAQGGEYFAIQAACNSEEGYV